MQEVAQHIDPNGILFENLPSMMTSDDGHELTGAVIGTQYLAQQAPGNRISINLVNMTKNLLSYHERRNNHLQAVDELTQEGKIARLHFLTGILKTDKPIVGHMEATHTGIALFSLAQHKIKMGYAGDHESLVEDFTRPLDATRGFSRSRLLYSWLQPAYRSILNEKEPDTTDLKVAKAARHVARGCAKNPAFFVGDIFDAWKERKLSKKLAYHA